MNDTLNIPNQKYELTDKTMNIGNSVYYQIRAIKDFGEVHSGDLGGWVESPLCLSQRGKCWIDTQSFIEKNARVSGNAKIVRSSIENSAVVSGDVVIYDSYVRDNAKVTDKASIFNSNIIDNACVMENPIVRKSSIIRDNAVIKGRCLIERSYIEGSALVKDTASVCSSILRDNAKVFGKAIVTNSVLHNKSKVYGKARVDYECSLFDKAEIFGSSDVKHVFMHDNSKISGQSKVKTIGKYDFVLEMYDNTQIKGNSIISIEHQDSMKEKPYIMKGDTILSDVEIYYVNFLDFAIKKANKEQSLSVNDVSQNMAKVKGSLKTRKEQKTLKSFEDLGNEL